MRGKENLTAVETAAVAKCAELQKLCKTYGKNLTSDIRENSKHLVGLYQMQRIMEVIREVLPQHDVIDKKTGKNLGSLYDNEYVEAVMMATNITIDAAVRHTEWNIRRLTKKYLI